MVAAKTDSGPARVLIVEDDEMVRNSLDMLFSHYGWEVVAMASGDDAVAAMPSIEYRLAVVDHRMAGMSGVEVVRRLKTFSAAPVFMITGCVDPEIRFAAERAGADRFFAKPVQAFTLLEALEEISPIH